MTTSAVRVEVSETLIFSSATFSLFSLALYPPVTAANARPKIPVAPVCGLFLSGTPNAADVDCDVTGNRGFESLDLTSNDDFAIPNVKGAVAMLQVAPLPLALPNRLLEDTSDAAEDFMLPKPPKVRPDEVGCSAPAIRLNSTLELVLVAVAFEGLCATLLLKPGPNVGFGGCDCANNEEDVEGPVAKILLEDVELKEASVLDSVFPKPDPKTLLVDGIMAVPVSSERKGFICCYIFI